MYKTSDQQSHSLYFYISFMPNCMREIMNIQLNALYAAENLQFKVSRTVKCYKISEGLS